jgi:hypothetical protein
MDRHGQRWTAWEACKLYKLMFLYACDSIEAASILGSTEGAIIARLQKGGFIDDNYNAIEPLPNEMQFYRALKTARQFPDPAIPAEYRQGKLQKIFNKVQRPIVRVPRKKGRLRLVPVLKKQAARKKYNNNEAWQNYAEQAQANPFMRSHLYKAQSKTCMACKRRLSEADYQIHHTTYDHTCSFHGKIVVIMAKGRNRSLPDCESCFQENPERFQKCACKLCAVHGRCNKRLN